MDLCVIDVFELKHFTVRSLTHGWQVNILATPEFLNKKHLHFGQGLEFLKIGQGNRGLNQLNRRTTKDTIRNTKGKRRKIDQKIRDRDPYFFFNNFLFDMFSLPEA